MEKIVENGMVAVLVSPGHGAGWYTWHQIPELLFDPIVVRMVRDRKHSTDIEKYCEEKYGVDHYYGGASDLIVEMVPEGVLFRIDEYDGYETLVLASEMQWIVA